MDMTVPSARIAEATSGARRKKGEFTSYASS